MTKLSEYVEIAADEYLLETGNTELDARWTAEFFQDSGVLEEYPRQSLVEFFNLVQKELFRKAEFAEKQTLLHMDRILQSIKQPGKS